MTKEMYSKILRKTYACIRHEIWKQLEDYKKKNGSTRDVFDKVQKEVGATFDEIRRLNYEILMQTKVEDWQASKIM